MKIFKKEIEIIPNLDDIAYKTVLKEIEATPVSDRVNGIMICRSTYEWTNGRWTNGYYYLIDKDNIIIDKSYIDDDLTNDPIVRRNDGIYEIYRVCRFNHHTYPGQDRENTYEVEDMVEKEYDEFGNLIPSTDDILPW